MSHSRIEAILENILGAENILDDPQSRIESILQSILYDTSYDESPKSRIEEMLLCLKNDTEYSIEPQSRIEEILLAKIEEIEYTKPAQSRIEKLLIEWLYKDLYISLSGVPPLTFESTGQTVTGSETGVAIPTVDGQNTLSVDTVVQPSKVDIMYAPKKSELKSMKRRKMR